MDQTDLLIVIGWTVVWLSLLAWVWIIPAERFQRLTELYVFDRMVFARGVPWVVVLGVRVVLSVVTVIILLVVGWPPVPPFATLWGSAA
jgi:hypothetical protein